MGLSYSHVCPICGKQFYVPDRMTYAYRRVKTTVRGKYLRTCYFCSWHCFRIDEKEGNKK